MNPFELDYLVSFDAFEDWWRTRNGDFSEIDAIESSYEQYKCQFSAKLAQTFVKVHKEEPWFQERYGNIIGEKTRQTIQQRRLLLLEQFFLDLDEGKYDAPDYNPRPAALYFKTFPLSASREFLEKALSKIPGFAFLSLSAPFLSEQARRRAWVFLDDQNKIESAMEFIGGTKITVNEQQMTLYPSVFEPYHRTLLTLPDVLSLPTSIVKDLEQTRRVIQKFVSADYDVVGRIRKRVLASLNVDETDDNIELTRRTLDLQLAFLRHVCCYCYYCVVDGDSWCELDRKCSGHVRSSPPPGDYEPNGSEERWISDWNDRLMLFLEPDKADLQSLGGVNKEDYIQTAMKAHYVQEEEHKFRCRVGDCVKLFKGLDFVIRHMESRHNEWYDGLADEVQLLNNYIRDPARPVEPTSRRRSEGRQHRSHQRSRSPRRRRGADYDDRDRRSARAYQDLDAPQEPWQEMTLDY